MLFFFDLLHDPILMPMNPPSPIANSIAIANSNARFGVRRVYCVGRNYADHAREMGHDPTREPPFFFCKPADALVPSGSALPFPLATKDLHHEIELVVALGKGGTHIAEADALGCVYGYAVGLDMTRRDIQAEAKKLARPWDLAKGFDASAPISPIVPASNIGHPAAGAIWLKINGELRQQGDLNQQIWQVAETIAYLSAYMALAPGDLIFTGTPAGVGPVQRGDVLHGHVAGVGDLHISYQG
jgi:fumarylpyruvate hydrolase